MPDGLDLVVIVNLLRFTFCNNGSELVTVFGDCYGILFFCGSGGDVATCCCSGGVRWSHLLKIVDPNLPSDFLCVPFEFRTQGKLQNVGEKIFDENVAIASSKVAAFRLLWDLRLPLLHRSSVAFSCLIGFMLDRHLRIIEIERQRVNFFVIRLTSTGELFLYL
ncbi:hypothetical protein M9H77_09565 [Catharanthus roseus]|uniref:Uncharacterized protein n=1 Tax=Catharanthus roseus TaxID=4058 RepID=A0ACC0C158_CATRO|nr:hypothetical protein M9H77_09565 [Catharanthus roseus]